MTKKKYQKGMGMTARVNLKMKDEDKFRMEQAAMKYNFTLSELIRVAVDHYTKTIKPTNNESRHQ